MSTTNFQIFNALFLCSFSLTFTKEIALYYKISNHELTRGLYQNSSCSTDDECASQCSNNHTCTGFSVKIDSHMITCSCQLSNEPISLSLIKSNPNLIKEKSHGGEKWNSYISNVQQRFWITPNHKVQLLNNITTMNVSSVEACAKKCYTSESCAVFLFHSGVCNFAASYNKSGGFLRHQNVDTYEKLEENSTIHNFFIFGNGRLSDDKEIEFFKLKTLESCATTCSLRESDCKSFGYEPIDGNCVLYSASAANDSTLFESTEAITHYEPHNKITKQFTVKPFTSFQSESAVKRCSISLLQCAEQCLQIEEFICRSISYAHNTCSMFSETMEHGSSDEEALSSLYFEVKPFMECSGSNENSIEIIDQEGVISSPGWPIIFLPRTQCAWKFSSYANQQIFLKFTYFNKTDKIDILINENRIGSFPENIIKTDSGINRVRYRSPSYNFNSLYGFRLFYKISSDNEEPFQFDRCSPLEKQTTTIDSRVTSSTTVSLQTTSSFTEEVQSTPATSVTSSTTFSLQTTSSSNEKVQSTPAASVTSSTAFILQNTTSTTGVERSTPDLSVPLTTIFDRQNVKANAIVSEKSNETVIATVCVVLLIVLIVILTLLFKQKRRQIQAKKANSEFTRHLSQRRLIEEHGNGVNVIDFSNCAYQKTNDLENSIIYDNPTPLIFDVNNHQAQSTNFSQNQDMMFRESSIYDDPNQPRDSSFENYQKMNCIRP